MDKRIRECPRCNAQVDSSANFCPRCGFKFSDNFQSKGERHVEKDVKMKNADDVKQSMDEKPNVSKKDQSIFQGESKGKVPYRVVSGPRINFSTLGMIFVELIVSYFVVIILVTILGFFPGDLFYDLTSGNFMMFSIVAITVFLEYKREVWLNNSDTENNRNRYYYGAQNYSKYEDVIDRYVYDNEIINMNDPLFSLNSHVNMDGEETAYLQPDEVVLYCQTNVLYYSIREWQEDPVYMTQQSGNTAVTFNVSDDEIHKDWSIFGNGTLYVTNHHIFYYSPARGKYNRNMIAMSLNRISFIKGHDDLGNAVNCIHVRWNGNINENIRDMYFGPAESNDSDTQLVDISLGQEFVKAVRQAIANDMHFNSNNLAYI
ncbi:hypothetical protein YK48G_18880 [Lentilactobacillus fungorum]|uniref:Zinc-ribbon domain-containing protein n=1 Tax=Lentilactobacillus fungorum TaxID=2201250 RepID=A0ABQ3VZY3_9LACO|nr:zinc ribbon domain-containing protein [Lentilactobacillus fungorum]GHP14463.1 hypothetical protein YK48G_18880 [Lentilactobacillus fungorum]